MGDVEMEAAKDQITIVGVGDVVELQPADRPILSYDRGPSQAARRTVADRSD
jgi:hypothetical protein